MGGKGAGGTGTLRGMARGVEAPAEFMSVMRDHFPSYFAPAGTISGNVAVLLT